MAVSSYFSAILVIAWVSQQFSLTAFPMLTASTGASAVIVFVTPKKSVCTTLAAGWWTIGVDSRRRCSLTDGFRYDFSIGFCCQRQLACHATVTLFSSSQCSISTRTDHLRKFNNIIRLWLCASASRPECSNHVGFSDSYQPLAFEL
jgi:hypothetical protein